MLEVYFNNVYWNFLRNLSWVQALFLPVSFTSKLNYSLEINRKFLIKDKRNNSVYLPLSFKIPGIFSYHSILIDDVSFVKDSAKGKKFTCHFLIVYHFNYPLSICALTPLQFQCFKKIWKFKLAQQNVKNATYKIIL